MCFVLYSFDIYNYRQRIACCGQQYSMGTDLLYTHVHLYSYVIRIGHVCSGTHQHCCSGMNLIYILWLNIGNDIGFPNKSVNMNRLDTYQHILTCWLLLQRLSQKNIGKVNLQEANLLENGCANYACC